MRRAALALVFVSALAEAAPKAYFSGSFDGRYAERLNSPSGPASQRYYLRFAQTFEVSPSFKAVVGFSGWSEAVYAARPDLYSRELARDDSSDLRFRDAFVQWQGRSLSLKLGNQQIAWGEALGGSIVDVVNPKDLRDGGFGDLADVRLQTPMANAKAIFGSASLQALYIPQPFFNLLPSPGNPYAFPYARVAGAPNVSVAREPSLPWSPENAEYGGRASAMLGGWDFSLMYLDHFDRNPWYQLLPASSPQTIAAQEKHARVKSYGASVTSDLGGFILRMEGLWVEGRRFPSLSPSGLGSVAAGNSAWLVGLDFPTWQGFNFSAQWTQDDVDGPSVGLLRTQRQGIATGRLARTLFRDHEAEISWSYSASDEGQKGFAKYRVPLSRRAEASIGAELFSGPPTSDFGRREGASRAFVALRFVI